MPLMGNSYFLMVAKEIAQYLPNRLPNFDQILATASIRKKYL